MCKICCKTRGNSSPKGKGRVYFTCHPNDFDTYFEKLCEDIFQALDCAVYYTENMSAAFSEEERNMDLANCNLFVVPITYNLLSTPNRAMDHDIAFAKSKHIPILPIMMEIGLDGLYSERDKFGEMHYISPFARDQGGLSYEKKLKDYLNTVLVGDELAKRIRDAFDAYIFLSYRKIDRVYANELIQLIHKEPKYRNIAIWYDEFLTPGESFKDNIHKIISDCKLFAILITPNVLEDNNYVKDIEYPAAVNAKKTVLAAEMVKTDYEYLLSKYDGMPKCIDPRNENELKESLSELLFKIAKKESDEAMHNYLIGLAYLNGIDVEIDCDYGLKLVTAAADHGLPEAIRMLQSMYYYGNNVPIDYIESLKWQERLTERYFELFGEESPQLLCALNDLGLMYADAGDFNKAVEKIEESYVLSSCIFGEESLDSLISLGNLAALYGELEKTQTCFELSDKVYSLLLKNYGEENYNTVIALGNLAAAYSGVDNHNIALEYYKKVYSFQCDMLGYNDDDTLVTLENIAEEYSCLGDYRKSFDLKKKTYDIKCEKYGEEHPYVLSSMYSLAMGYGDIGDNLKKLNLLEKSYSGQCKVFGEEHRLTVSSLEALAYVNSELGDHQNSHVLYNKLFEILRKKYGEKHHDTISALRNSLNELLEYNRVVIKGSRG